MRVHEVLHADGLGGLEDLVEVDVAEEGLVGAGEIDRELLAGTHQLLAELDEVVRLGVGEPEVDQARHGALEVGGERLADAVHLDGELHGCPSAGVVDRGHFTAPAVRPATKFFCIMRKPTTTGIDTASEAARTWFQ